MSNIEDFSAVNMKSVERNEETSTAKAHYYEEPFEFPASNFKVRRFITLFSCRCNIL